MQAVHTPAINPFGEAFSCVWEDEHFAAGMVCFQGWRKLSIARKGLWAAKPMSWEELQKVKSDCGFGHLDAVEVYPRDCDVVNTGNIRHLFIFEKPLSFAMRVQPGETLSFED